MVARVAVVICSCLLGLATAAEPVAELAVPRLIVPGRRLGGQVEVDGASARIDDVAIPDVPGLILELNRNKVGYESINGHNRVRMGLTIGARATGTYTIPSVTVTLIDGTTLITEPVTVTCAGPRDDLAGDCHAIASFRPATVVPGQTTLVRWRIFLPYDRSNVAASVPDELGLDRDVVLTQGEVEKDFAGFALDSERQLWQVTDFQRPVTFQTPGTYQSSGQVSYGHTNWVGRLQVTGNAAVRPATVRVIALPREGRPDDFSGLIGEVTVRSTVERQDFSAGEGTRLTVRVEGDRTDLLTGITLPDLAGIAVYEQEVANPPGARVFAYDLVPARAGTYTIPPISVPWFDPEVGRYRQAQSQPITINVHPGRRIEAQASVPTPASTPERPQLPVSLLPPPLRGEATWHRAPGSGWWLLALGLGLGLIAGISGRLWQRRAAIDHEHVRLLHDLTSDDLAVIDTALHRLAARCPDAARRERLHTCLSAVEQARFGGGALDQVTTADIHRLARELR